MTFYKHSFFKILLPQLINFRKYFYVGPSYTVCSSSVVLNIQETNLSNAEIKRLRNLNTFISDDINIIMSYQKTGIIIRRTEKNWKL